MEKKVMMLTKLAKKIEHKLIVLLLLTLFSLISCYEEWEPADTASGDDDAIRLTYTISGAGLPTRFSAGGTFEEGDSVGIYMIPHQSGGDPALESALITNVKAVSDASGNFSPQFKPPVGTSVNFVSYLPYIDTLATKLNHKIPVTLPANVYPVPDMGLLYANGVGQAVSRGGVMDFNYQSAMCKLTMTAAADEGYDLSMEGARLTITGIPTTADFNLKTGKMENFGGTDVEVPLQYSHNTSSDTAHWEALIIPHLAMDVPGDRVFTFKFAGDEERPWAVEDLEGKKIDFEAGQNYQYSFIVKEKTITTSDGMSNCYMVAPNTTLKFPVKRAYADATTLRTGDAFADGTFQVKVLWQDPANLLTSPTTTLANASGTGPMAEVSVTTASGKTGNAVIGIYKSSDTTKPVWSYHIWVTDPDEIVPWENTKQTAAKYIFMDRNLGATAAANSIAGRGLLYQWGRKDPFPGGPNKAGDAGAAGYAALSSFEGLGTTKKVTDSSYAGTDKTTAAQIIASIKHPTVFFSSVANGDWLSTKDDGLWNVTSGSKRIKSIYDPCPEGWRVPEHVGNSGSEANSPWKSLTTNAFIEGDSGGATFEASKNHSYYPAAGYRSSSGGSFDYGGNSGVYWSASVTGGNGYYLYFRYYGNVAVAYSSLRANGFSVRCVQES